MAELFERHRPADWSQVVGQDTALRTIDRWRKRGELAGRKLWIQGGSGTGKTTIARLYASEVADDIAIREVDAGELTEASAKEMIRQLRPTCHFGGKRGRALIVNEAHRLSRAVVGAFLTLLETDFPSHAVVIFTTTSEGAEKFEDGFDAKPFLSRCTAISLARRGIAEPFARRAAEIAIAEQLAPDGSTLEEITKRIARYIQDDGANLRAILSKIDGGALLAN